MKKECGILDSCKARLVIEVSTNKSEQYAKKYQNLSERVKSSLLGQSNKKNLLKIIKNYYFAMGMGYITLIYPTSESGL
jgi:hypothetical protein